MKRLTLLLVAIVSCLSLFAWTYDTTEQTTEQSVQLRAGADFTKKWNNGLRLGVSEDLRFDLYNSLTGANFNKSYTTLTLAYAPNNYFKVDAGYVLKIMGTKDWSDVNEWMRHRAFMSVTGSYQIGQVKLSLRERVMCEIRTDSVNLDEKNRYNWLLRSKLSAEYSLRSKPLKPYAWIELVNTLNVPEYQKKYKDNDTSNKGTQYITKVRTTVGLKYRLDQHNTLNFYYRFNYAYDRDININKGYYTKGKDLRVELTEEKTYQHAIGVTYEFGW